jgi:hypothetical protein
MSLVFYMSILVISHCYKKKGFSANRLAHSPFKYLARTLKLVSL